MEESLKVENKATKEAAGLEVNNDSETFNNLFKRELGIKKVNPATYSPLSLAYIGDSVFEIIIRTIMVSECNMQVQKYHKRASTIVNARAQAKMVDIILPILSEEEMDIYKRGRNAKSYTKAKNASVSEYRIATGFEALIGYLYLSEKYERIVEIVKAALAGIEW